MIGMGIDASTTCIGWSIFDDDNLIDYGKIVPTIEGLEWRDRIINLAPQLRSVIKKYKPKQVFIEDVPLMKKGGAITILQLGAVQGMLLSLFSSYNVQITFLSVGKWRKDIRLHNGTEEGKERDSLKIASIDKANELFGINLNKIFTRNGTFKSSVSDDDISDSILIYASTREKYRPTIRSFGKGVIKS